MFFVGSYFCLLNSPVLLLLLDEADSGLKGCSASTRLLFEISEHALFFQIFSVVLRMFLIKNFDPDWFSCKPFPPKCLIHYYCLPCLSSIGKGVLHVICALPPSVRNVIVNTKILHVGKLFFTRTFNFKILSKTVRDGKFLASFVPICKIMLLSFFWIHVIR